MFVFMKKYLKTLMYYNIKKIDILHKKFEDKFYFFYSLKSEYYKFTYQFIPI